MPDSDTPLEWYPSGWTESIQERETGRDYIEWAYEEDPTINVVLTPTEDEPGYTVWAQAGVNEDGEKMKFRPVWGLSRENAYAVAFTLFSAMNGTVRRINGDPSFNGGN